MGTATIRPIPKDMLDDLVGSHNQRDDQRWGRTLSCSRFGNRAEYIGVCNYGNLYFLQFEQQEDGMKARQDWIKKSLLSKKYQNIDMSNVPVRDNILDKFRYEFNKEVKV